VRVITAATMGALFALSATMQSSGQNVVQPLTFAMIAYNQSTPTATRSIRFTNKDIIRYFNGSSVNGGQISLVTPQSSGMLTGTGNLNSFIRITQRTTTILEVPTPDSFNLFQDSVVSNQRGQATSSVGTDRFSIDFAGLHAELQGLLNWVNTASASGVGTGSVSGTGAFNGGTGIFNTGTSTGFNSGSAFGTGSRTVTSSGTGIVTGTGSGLVRQTSVRTTPDGSGTFRATGVTGTGTIDGVTEGGVPMTGTITGGFPVIEDTTVTP
jgi:hypothetical protein